MAALGISLSNLNIPSTLTVPLSVLNPHAQMKSTDYSKLDLYDQILLRPPMYIGSPSKSTRQTNDRILTIVNGACILQEMTTDYPLGCERLYLELLYNATDNVFNS